MNWNTNYQHRGIRSSINSQSISSSSQRRRRKSSQSGGDDSKQIEDEVLFVNPIDKDIPKQVENLCSLRNYHPISELGEGSFSYVWKVEELTGEHMGRISALKVLKGLKQRYQVPGLNIAEEGKFQQELFTYTKDVYQEELVPEVYSFDQYGENQGYILMKAYDVKACLASSKIRYGNEWLKTIRNIARVHQIIHDTGRHNGDLKRRNAFRGGIVGDFGSCEKMYSFRKSKKDKAILCTAGYASPEQLQLIDSTDSRQTDVFSLGIVAYMLACNKAPFEHKTFAGYKRNLIESEVVRLEQKVDYMPSVVANLVHSMIEFCPMLRPTMPDVVRSLDELIEGHNQEKLERKKE
jgi:serine/threonine protein kinase